MVFKLTAWTPISLGMNFIVKRPLPRSTTSHRSVVPEGLVIEPSSEFISTPAKIVFQLINFRNLPIIYKSVDDYIALFSVPRKTPLAYVRLIISMKTTRAPPYSTKNCGGTVRSCAASTVHPHCTVTANEKHLDIGNLHIRAYSLSDF